MGDVIRILDEDGTAVVSYTYDPWGVPSVTGDTELAAINPCSYRGYYYDQETGYYYLQSRYYDPEIGRFLNADATWTIALMQGSIVQYNLFTYCLNSPISSYDINGFARIYIVLKVSFLRDFVTAGCSALAAAICTAIFGGNAYAGIVGAALGWIIGGSLSRAYVKRDLKFSVWIPFIRSRTFTIW